MRRTIYVLIFWVVIVSGSSVELDTDDQRLQEFMEHVGVIQAECEHKENAKRYSSLSEEEFQETHEWKCTLECVASELGMFRNHRFYEKGFTMMIVKLFPNQDEQVKPIISAIASKCKTKEFHDRCEAAYEFLTCIEKVVDVSINNFV